VDRRERPSRSCESGLRSDPNTQVVSSFPPSLPNRIVFIALYLQLPLSQEAAGKTSPREAKNLRSDSVQDPIVEAAQRNRTMSWIQERRKRPAEDSEKLPR